MARQNKNLKTTNEDDLPVNSNTRLQQVNINEVGKIADPGYYFN